MSTKTNTSITRRQTAQQRIDSLNPGLGTTGARFACRFSGRVEQRVRCCGGIMLRNRGPEKPGRWSRAALDQSGDLGSAEKEQCMVSGNAMTKERLRVERFGPHSCKVVCGRITVKQQQEKNTQPTQARSIPSISCITCIPSAWQRNLTVCIPAFPAPPQTCIIPNLPRTCYLSDSRISSAIRPACKPNHKRRCNETTHVPSKDP